MNYLTHGHCLATALKGVFGGVPMLLHCDADVSLSVCHSCMQEGSFDEAVKGVTYVFHTASPYSLDTSDPDKLIDPALKGTKNVLNAVAKHKDSIKRVVLTSSIAGE